MELKPKKKVESCPTSGVECEFCKKPLLFNRLEARVSGPCQLENCPAGSRMATAVAA